MDPIFVVVRRGQHAPCVDILGAFSTIDKASEAARRVARSADDRYRSTEWQVIRLNVDELLLPSEWLRMQPVFRCNMKGDL